MGLAERLRRREGPTGPPPALQPLKRRAIDRAIDLLGWRSAADLGGVWAVEAGYSFHLLDRGLERVVLVDTGVTPAVRARAAAEPRLQILEGSFGSPDAVAATGAVDGVLLFDVLLHQVDPDWDGVLALWAPATRSFLVVQPQLATGDDSVRLVELGEQRYRAMVPDEENHRLLFGRLDEVHPRYGRPWRDVHEVWQWGVTDRDLHRALTGLGYRCRYYEDEGPWRGLAHFRNRAFLYERVDPS